MKNNLDKLFKTELDDFEQAPNPEVWHQIQKKLVVPKTTKSYLNWLIPSGLAAGLALFLFLYQTKKTTQKEDKKVVVDEKIEKINPQQNPDKLISVDTINQVQVIMLDAETKQNKNNNGNSKDNNFVDALKNNTASSDKEEQKSINENAVLSEKPTSNKPILKTFNKILEKNSTANVAKNTKKNSTTSTPEEKTVTEKDTTNNNQVANLDLNDNKGATNKLATDKPNENEVNFHEKISAISTITDTTKNKNINPLIKTSEITQNTLTNEPHNELEKLEELLEKENITNSKLNRWQLTSNVAPIFMGSLSGGSPIGNQFINNNKDYQTTMSYGVGVQFAINEKIKLRTGLNNVQLSYNTNDVLFFTDLQGGVFLNNVSFTNNIDLSNMVIVSRFDQAALNSYGFSNINGNLGSINQEMGFFEVPMELSYQMNESKKFKVHFIGGFSTLFLNRNLVSLQDVNGMMELGTANNINSMHWSTNVGFGFQYVFSKNWSFQSEPMLKYQFNTFDSSANFTPFWLGVQTGLHYKF